MGRLDAIIPFSEIVNRGLYGALGDQHDASCADGILASDLQLLGNALIAAAAHGMRAAGSVAAGRAEAVSRPFPERGGGTCGTLLGRSGR